MDGINVFFLNIRQRLIGLSATTQSQDQTSEQRHDASLVDVQSQHRIYRPTFCAWGSSIAPVRQFVSQGKLAKKDGKVKMAARKTLLFYDTRQGELDKKIE